MLRISPDSTCVNKEEQMNKIARWELERYELIGGGSKKFWEVGVEENVMTLHWGKIGTNGQQKPIEFSSNEKAVADKIIRVEKQLKQGYRLVGNIEKKIVAVEQLDPKHAHNEAFFMVELLSWYLKNKFTAKEVEKRLNEFVDWLDDPHGLCNEEKEGEAETDDLKILCKALAPFDAKKAFAVGPKIATLSGIPDLDALSAMLGNNWLDYYKTALKEKVDHFMIYDEETGYVSLAIVAGPVTQEDLVKYKDN